MTAITTTTNVTTLAPLTAVVPPVPRSRGPGHVDSVNDESHSHAPSHPPTRPPSCYNTPRVEAGRKASRDATTTTTGMERTMHGAMASDPHTFHHDATSTQVNSSNTQGIERSNMNGSSNKSRLEAAAVDALRTPSPQTPPLAGGSRLNRRGGSETARSTLSIPFRIEDVETDRTSIDFNIESVLHTRGQSLAAQTGEFDTMKHSCPTAPTPLQANTNNTNTNAVQQQQPPVLSSFMSNGTSEIHFVQESLPPNEKPRDAAEKSNTTITSPGTRATSIDIEFHEEPRADESNNDNEHEEVLHGIRPVSPMPHIPLTYANTTNKRPPAVKTARKPAVHNVHSRVHVPLQPLPPPVTSARKPALPPEAIAPAPLRRTNTNNARAKMNSAPGTARRVASAPRRPMTQAVPFNRAATATLASPRKPHPPQQQQVPVQQRKMGYDKPWRTNSAPVRPKANNTAASNMPDPRMRVVRKASTPRFRHRQPNGNDGNGPKEEEKQQVTNVATTPNATPLPRATAATRRGRDGYEVHRKVRPVKAVVHSNNNDDGMITTPRASEFLPRPHPAITSHTKDDYNKKKSSATNLYGAISETIEKPTAEEVAAWCETPSQLRVHPLTALAAEVQEWAETTTQQKTLQVILSTARAQDRAIAASVERIAAHNVTLDDLTRQLYTLRDTVVQRRGADLTGMPLASTRRTEKAEHNKQQQQQQEGEARSSPISARLYRAHSGSSRSVSPTTTPTTSRQQHLPPQQQQQCSCLSDEDISDAERQSHEAELRAWWTERMRLREELARLRERRHDLRFHWHRGTYIKPLSAMQTSRSHSGMTAQRGASRESKRHGSRSPSFAKAGLSDTLLQLRYEQQELAAALTRSREEHHTLIVRARRQRRSDEARLQAAMADRQACYTRWATQVEQLREQRRRLATLTRSAESNVVLSPRSHRQALQRLREYTAYSDNILARTEQRVRSA